MKPVSHIAKLINNLSVKENVQTGRIRQIISVQQYPEKMIIIIHQGVVALYRGHDHMLISHTHAPFALGLNFCTDKNPDVYLQALSQIQFETLPMDSVLEVIRKKNLWEHACYVSMFSNLRWLENHFGLTGVSTYRQICHSLNMLQLEPEVLRLAMNASIYIHERTNLSRSGIMKILSELKGSGHIEMERGILLKINKLPEEF